MVMGTDLEKMIRQAMRQDGRTVCRLATDAHIDRAILGRFIRGERGLTLVTASRLCEALGLELKSRRRKGGK